MPTYIAQAWSTYVAFRQPRTLKCSWCRHEHTVCRQNVAKGDRWKKVYIKVKTFKKKAMAAVYYGFYKWNMGGWIKGLPPPLLDPISFIDAIVRFQWKEKLERAGIVRHSWWVPVTALLALLTHTALEDYGIGEGEDFYQKRRQQHKGNMATVVMSFVLIQFFFLVNLGFKV